MYVRDVGSQRSAILIACVIAAAAAASWFAFAPSPGPAGRVPSRPARPAAGGQVLASGSGGRRAEASDGLVTTATTSGRLPGGAAWKLVSRYGSDTQPVTRDQDGGSYVYRLPGESGGTLTVTFPQAGPPSASQVQAAARQVLADPRLQVQAGPSGALELASSKLAALSAHAGPGPSAVIADIHPRSACAGPHPDPAALLACQASPAPGAPGR